MTSERIAEFAKRAIKWSAHPPHHVPALHEVMDVMRELADEAAKEAVGQSDYAAKGVNPLYVAEYQWKQ